MYNAENMGRGVQKYANEMPAFDGIWNYQSYRIISRNIKYWLPFLIWSLLGRIEYIQRRLWL